jgi:hypothetical protein
MVNRVLLFVVFAIMLTLFVPAKRVDERIIGQFGSDLANVRSQGLALFGLPIKIPRRPSPVTTSLANTTTSANNRASNDTQAADLVLALLERAELVQMVTVVPTITATPSPTIVATATTAQTRMPVATATNVVIATETTQVTATITPTLEVATATPEMTATAIPVSTTEVALLPNSILNGFRSRMPKKGYWWGSVDGLYTAVGNFGYIKSFYSNDAESFQKYVTFSITVRNDRNPAGTAITIDPTNITLIDLDRRQSMVYRDYIHLDQAFLKTTIAPGQTDGGQLIFVVERFAAPAQLIITYTNADQPDVIHTQTLELRVWPTVN